MNINSTFSRGYLALNKGLGKIVVEVIFLSPLTIEPSGRGSTPPEDYR